MVKMITIVLVGSLLLHLTVIESFLPWNPGSFRFISHSDSGIAGSSSLLTASISPLTSSDIIQAARSSLPNPTNSDILQEIKNSITVSDPKLSVQQETLKVALTRIANALSRANVDPNLLDSMISEANQPLSIIGNINTLNLTSEHLYYYLAAIAIDALQPKPLMKVTQKKTAVHILFGLSSSGKTTIAAQLASWMIQNNYGKRILVLLNDVKDIPTFEKLKKTFGGGTLIEYLLPETAKAVTPGSLQLSLLKNTLTPFYQKAIAKATSERYDAVLIDLPSESYLDRFYLDNVKALKSSLNADELLLVLDAEKVQQSTYLAVRSSENGVDTTGCIISNLNKNTNTGLVFNMNDIFSSLSLKFESRGNDMNDFTPFNAKEYIFNVFDINPSIFQDLAERAELFGSKLKLTPEVFQDLRIAGKFFSREDAVMTQFFHKSMQIYELLTEEERNDPYSFIEIFGTDPNLEKKEKLWKQIASRKAGFSKTSIYCLGLFMREFWFMIYDLFEPVREIAGVESKFPGRSPAKDKAAAPSAGKGFGSKSKTQEQADSPYGFDIKGKINRLPKDISSFFPTNEMLKQRGLLEILNNFPTSNP